MKEKKLKPSKNNGIKNRKRTVKFRITFWFCLLISIAFAVISVIVIICTDEFAMGFASDMIEEAVKDAKMNLSVENENGEKTVTVSASTPREVYIIIYDADGSIIYSERELAFINNIPDMNAATNIFYDEKGETWQTYDEEIQSEDYGKLWVRGVSSAKQSRQTIKVFILASLCSFPVIVSLVAVLGYLFIVKAFEPVNKIRESAENIAQSGDLTKHVELYETTTNPKDELFRLAKTFDEMLKKLNGSVERNRQFTSDVSHELRTPVAVIVSQCEAALKAPISDENARKTIQSVYEEALAVSVLIRQLLMLSRADNNTQALCFENVDLCGIADAVCDQLSETAAKKRICIHKLYRGEIKVNADEMLIMRLLINLVQNSISYGKTDGNVWVNITADKDCEITVTDDGKGISPEALPKIFDRFYREDESHTSSNSGLGLSIVKWIADAHNGKITVHSQPGKFSEFTVTLPLNN